MPLKIFLVFLLAICVMGCSGEKSPPGTVTLVLKTFRFPSSEAIEKLLGTFEDLNPGIRVRHELLPNSSDEQHQFYVTNLQAGAADFDVFALDVVWGPEFARAGWLADLTPRLPGGRLKGFFPGPVAAVTWEKRVYAIPFFVDAGILYYRKDLLKKYGLKPPETFGELVKGAYKILDGEKRPTLGGFVWQGKQYEGLVCNALEYIWGAGGDVIGKDGKCLLAGPEAVKAVAFMRSLVSDARLSPPMVATADEESCRNVFGNGNAIFMRNWPYCWNIFQQEGSAVRGKVGITRIPGFSRGKGASTLGGWQLAVNPKSKHPEEAWKLLAFLTGEAGQKAVALAYGFKPARPALYSDPDLVREQPFITGLARVMERARPRPVTPIYPAISQALQGEFSAALVGTKTPEQAMRDAARAVDSLSSR